jgi:hypothetical protein
VTKKFALAIIFSSLIANTASLPVARAPVEFSDSRFLALLKLAPRLAPQALEAALTALKRLQATGTKVRADVLTVIDYTKPSNERRLWVFDLTHTRVLFEELTAHGKNSGDNEAVRFFERAQQPHDQPWSIPHWRHLHWEARFVPTATGPGGRLQR